MNVALWIGQGLLAVVFLYSGLTKASLAPARLVAMGQTGVEGLAVPLIRFIGIAEVLGVLGLVLPVATGVAPVLTPIAAACLGVVMALAAPVHYRRHEPGPVVLNVFLLVLCGLVAWGRLVY